ncbi:MAG: adenylate/guanylate cyclase domain-containing protein [Pseudanabaena sp. M090S1SP1A06QC]|jgi:CHASE2 domain-containing sensor protein/class 3 adenylate cyclase|nr:adenylate/guanylate cyclase domain-containing protein [Pseudanabaena sp. M051S1SP1A06QC]MCA6587869.1 adenylate/guanylate cyclase domain-containing protein [Pseudanabaena sp. M109S1SP1A06QC]MCA6604510.1 adenylate/guanylate cyclase domain-containing protein [Pseudanabaena sp. M007S1SP1A06QC]MCA6613438.1 adenylate/guanylate cyclase domain-containing protein [Pseudanabaena sp. M090S1SP1A06QC]
MKLPAPLVNFGAFCKCNHQRLIAGLITLSVSLGVLVLRDNGVFRQIELLSYDSFMRSQLNEPSDQRIVIVEISEADIQRFRWPFSDRLFAKLINQIASAKPAVIGIDKYLDLPVLDGRSELVEATKNAGNVVNATFLATVKGRSNVEPAKDLAQISRHGYVNLSIDKGAVVRRSAIVGDSGSFAFEITQLYLQKLHSKQIAFNPDAIQFMAGKQIIPRMTANYGAYRKEDDRGYQVMIRYRGKPRSFQHIRASDVIDGKFTPDQFRDRAVLIGVTAGSLKDSFATPVTADEEVMYGVEIHANIVSQLISATLDDRQFIQVWSNVFENLWIAVWAIIGGGLATFSPNAFKTVGLLVTLSISLTVGSYIAFAQALWLPIFPSLLGLILANVLVMSYQLAIQQSERKVLMGIFSRHVSKELVDIIWSNRDKFMEEGRITGQEVYVTVLFTDMRNFSTTAEAQAPGETLNWLNSYLGTIANEVLAHGGMVDKYIGDAVMAVFGVPIPHINETERTRDAQLAVEAALAIARKLAEMNDIWVAQGLPPVTTGIGINSGNVIAGSLGSSERLEYSVLGDAVNIAARLESFNKEVDGGPYHILISEDTHQRLNNNFKTEFVGKYALKGKKQETEIYRVLDIQKKSNPAIRSASSEIT